MGKLPPVRKRTDYRGVTGDDLTFALFYDRIQGDPQAMQEQPPAPRPPRQPRRKARKEDRDGRQ